MKVLLADNKEKIQNLFPCYQILRPHLQNIDLFCEQVFRQMKEGFSIHYIEENGAVVGCIGLRYLETLAWGKILYIDDLIASPESRGKGYGTKLLQFAKDLAINKNCEQIHLDTGYQRTDAHRVYLNFGFQLNCHHLSYKLNN